MDAPAAVPADGCRFDLATNLPPLRVLAERLRRLLQGLSAEAVTLADYPSEALLEGYQAAVCDWLVASADRAPPASAQVVACHGARAALTLCLQQLLPRGGAVLCDALCYAGFREVAAALQLRLVPLALDAQGCDPEALRRAAQASGARVWLAMPTLQNPTASVAGLERRCLLAEVAAQQELWIVEDDIYAPLLPADQALPPLAAWLPQRCLQVGSASKTLAPGLTAGWVVAPPGLAGALRERSQALGLTPSAWSLRVFSALQQSGAAIAILEDMRAELHILQQMAREILGTRRLPASIVASPHLWLPVADGRAEALHAALLQRGLRLTPAHAPLLQPGPAPGLRLCLGAAPTRQALQQALQLLRSTWDDFDAGAGS